MASPDVLEQIAKLKTESREDFEKPGSTVQEFYRLLTLFPHLLSEYNEGGRQISLSFMGGYTEPAIRDAQFNRYQLYFRMLSKLKQIKPKIDIVTYFREFLRDLVVASTIGKMMAGGKYHNVYIPPADLAARIDAFKVRMIELGGDQQWYDFFNTVIRPDRDYFEYGRQSEIEKLSEFVTKKIRRERPKINIPQPVRMSGPGYSTNGVSGYSHSMTPAGMRETAAREAAARNAAARNAASRNAETRGAAARLEAARANIRNMEARTAARRNAEARNAAAGAGAPPAPNNKKPTAPLNFWLRANGVKVMSAYVEDNKSYILLVTDFATNSDDVFKVTKIGDSLYKIGTYKTGKNNEILYDRMVQVLIEDEGALELYKVPDSLQSGGARKSRRNRRNHKKSSKSRKSRRNRK